MMINNSDQGLIYFEFQIDGSDLGRMFVEPATDVPSDVAESFLQACHPSEHGSASFFGATVCEVGPHSLLRLCTCIADPRQKLPSVAQSTSSGCSAFAPLENCFLLNTDHSSHNEATHETEFSCGLAYFGSHLSTGTSMVHPELCFSGHSCSCLDAGRWHLMGRLFMGHGILHHIASLDSDEARRPRKLCILKECGVVPPRGELGLTQKDAVLDYWPDSPRDAKLNLSEVDRILNIAYGIKMSGSVLFRQEKYQMAKFKFAKAIKYINMAFEGNDMARDHQNRLLSLLLPCILNSAASKLKLKDYDGALEDCNEALELGPQDPKVFFRRGQAHHGKMNYDQSLYDLYRALKLAPHDKSIKSEIAAVEGELQVYRKDLKKRKISSPFP